jgi:hypothetical protein
MRVDEWFWSLAKRHMARHPRADWPELDSEFWIGWKLAFIRHGVIFDVADEASVATMEKARFPDEHLDALLAAVRKVWASSEVLASPDSREAAERESKSCVDCSGVGLTVRFRHKGELAGKTEVCYCACLMGRWTEKRHREKDKQAHKGIRDLGDCPPLQLGIVGWQETYDNRYRHHPELWSEGLERPVLPIGIAGLTAVAKAEEKIRRDSAKQAALPRQIVEGLKPKAAFVPEEIPF